MLRIKGKSRDGVYGYLQLQCITSNRISTKALLIYVGGTKPSKQRRETWTSKYKTHFKRDIITYMTCMYVCSISRIEINFELAVRSISTAGRYML
jgi:hypothetical protein